MDSKTFQQFLLILLSLFLIDDFDLLRCLNIIEFETSLIADTSLIRFVFLRNDIYDLIILDQQITLAAIAVLAVVAYSKDSFNLPGTVFASVLGTKSAYRTGLDTVAAELAFLIIDPVKAESA